MASNNTPPPAERASEIINSMPSSPGLVSKTGAVLLGTGLSAAAISQELYVVNEESIIAAAFFLIVAALGRVRVLC
jgi:F-type H+-transporting ATPase subunit b